MGFLDRFFAGKSGKSPERTPRLVGDEATCAKIERILTRFSSAIRLQVNRKLDQCFADHKRHSVVWSIGDVYVWVNVHPGTFADVAPSLHGQYTTRFSSPDFSPDQYATLLMLDYFVHDPRNPVSPIDLALSLLPGRKNANLPEEMTSGLVHIEMLSEEELEMFLGKQNAVTGTPEEETTTGLAIGVRFDIDKLMDRSNSYGTEAWKVFWRALRHGDISGVSFRAGDEFSFGVYTIALFVNDKNPATIQKVRASLTASSDFGEVCASPQFFEDEARCAAQPLLDHGRMVGTELDCSGAQKDASWALDAIKREQQGAS